VDYTEYPTNRAEAKALSAKYYFTGKPCKHGHIALRKTKGSCVECMKTEWKESAAKRAEYFSAYNKSKAGQASKQKYYETNREQVIARANARPEEIKRGYKKEYKKRNPELCKALVSVRRRRHREATPLWITAEDKLAMRNLYLQAQNLSRRTGERYVVDHIIPIMSQKVCGLHVPWNLQIITQVENLKKSNKFTE